MSPRQVCPSSNPRSVVRVALGSWRAPHRPAQVLQRLLLNKINGNYLSIRSSRAQCIGKNPNCVLVSERKMNKDGAASELSFQKDRFVPQWSGRISDLKLPILIWGKLSKLLSLWRKPQMDCAGISLCCPNACILFFSLAWRFHPFLLSIPQYYCCCLLLVGVLISTVQILYFLFALQLFYFLSCNA